jgi:hypothetical protein
MLVNLSLKGRAWLIIKKIVRAWVRLALWWGNDVASRN